jgi:hypothetical protein
MKKKSQIWYISYRSEDGLQYGDMTFRADTIEEAMQLVIDRSPFKISRRKKNGESK